MPRLLLDEHISPDVAMKLRVYPSPRRCVVFYMAEWEKGRFMGQEDVLCLQEAARQNLTFVTYDRRTIPPIIKSWAEEGRNHGGIIFIDDKTISPADIGGLVRALAALSQETGKWDWSNRVYFLQRTSSH